MHDSLIADTDFQAAWPSNAATGAWVGPSAEQLSADVLGDGVASHPFPPSPPSPPALPPLPPTAPPGSPAPPAAPPTLVYPGNVELTESSVDAREVRITTARLGGTKAQLGSPNTIVPATTPSPTAMLKRWYIASTKDDELNVVIVDVELLDGKLALRSKSAWWGWGYEDASIEDINVDMLMSKASVATSDCERGYTLACNDPAGQSSLQGMFVMSLATRPPDNDPRLLGDHGHDAYLDTSNHGVGVDSLTYTVGSVPPPAPPVPPALPSPPAAPPQPPASPWNCENKPQYVGDCPNFYGCRTDREVGCSCLSYCNSGYPSCCLRAPPQAPPPESPPPSVPAPPTPPAPPASPPLPPASPWSCENKPQYVGDCPNYYNCMLCETRTRAMHTHSS